MEKFSVIYRYLKVRVQYFNLISHLFLFTVLITIFAGCSSLPENSYARSIAEKAAAEAATPVLEKIYLTQAPIQPVSLSTFEIVPQLPGGSFKPIFRPNSFSYDSNGILQLAAGDYIIPVMTYCMNASGASPRSITYHLSSLQGTRAELIKELNQKALPQFSPSDVQILSWSLQAGLTYDELIPQSRQIFDVVLPNRKNEIKESIFKIFQNEWDQISIKTDGLFPSFETSSDEFLLTLGSFGREILTARNFQKSIQQYGNDYSRLAALIDVGGSTAQTSSSTGWSKINDQVYARFLTEGHFQDIGQIQVRVINPQKRSPSALTNILVPIDLSSWVADPGYVQIQPLSFSMLLSEEGILLIPEIADAPLIAAALLSAILAAQVIDWDSFNQLKDFLNDVQDSHIQNLIRTGNIALNKVYDDLEKPARDAGVIDKNTKKSPDNKDSDTREYIKSGGVEQLGKDFDKMSGEAQSAKDGIPIKELSDGKKIVKRLESDGEQFPTLEIQPAKGSDRLDNRLRIKVRYHP